MLRFTDMSIRFKLQLAFGLIVLPLMTIAVASYFGFQRVQLAVLAGTEDLVLISDALSEAEQAELIARTNDFAKNIFSMTRASMLMMLVGAMTAFLVSTTVCFTLTGMLVRPIAQIVTTLRAVADGDYSQRVEVRGKDELSFMASQVNRLIDRLEEQAALLPDSERGFESEEFAVLSAQ